MKAAVYNRFGPADVLSVTEVPKPVPDLNEVLIRNYATVVAAEDPVMRRSPGINGILKPRHQILGQEFAGEITEIGRSVTRFRVGDQVYGESVDGLGCYAEFLAFPEDGAIALKPRSLDYQQAVAIPNGMLTAIPFLKETARLQGNEHVLIYGASGAVGTASIQFAKYLNCQVTAISSKANHELVLSLGADYAIDYLSEDFTKNGVSYDVIFDAVGKLSYSQVRNSLTRAGKFLSTMPSFSLFFHILLSRFTKRKVMTTFAGLRPAEQKRQNLEFISQLVDDGDIRPVIDSCYSLEQIVDAHLYTEKGHKKGNVVITI